MNVNLNEDPNFGKRKFEDTVIGLLKRVCNKINQIGETVQLLEVG